MKDLEIISCGLCCFQLKLEQLECLRSENTPALMITHTIDS